MRYIIYLLTISLIFALGCSGDDESEQMDGDPGDQFEYTISDKLLDNPSATLALLIHTDAGEVVYHQVQDKRLLSADHSFEYDGNMALNATFVRQYFRDNTLQDTLFEITTITDIQDGDKWEVADLQTNGSLRTVKLNIQGIATLDSIRISHFNNNNAAVFLDGNMLRLTFDKYENSATYVLIAANGESGYRYFYDDGEKLDFVQTFSQLTTDLKSGVITFPRFDDWHGNMRARNADNPDRYLRFFHIEQEPMQPRPPLMSNYRYYLPANFNVQSYDFEVYADGGNYSVQQLSADPVLKVNEPVVNDGDFVLLFEDAFGVSPNPTIDLYYAYFTLGKEGQVHPFVNSEWKLVGRPPQAGQRTFKMPIFPGELKAAMPSLESNTRINKLEVDATRLEVPLDDIRWNSASAKVFSQSWKENQHSTGIKVEVE